MGLCVLSSGDGDAGPITAAASAEVACALLAAGDTDDADISALS